MWPRLLVIFFLNIDLQLIGIYIKFRTTKEKKFIILDPILKPCNGHPCNVPHYKKSQKTGPLKYCLIADFTISFSVLKLKSFPSVWFMWFFIHI